MHEETVRLNMVEWTRALQIRLGMDNDPLFAGYPASQLMGESFLCASDTLEFELVSMRARNSGSTIGDGIREYQTSKLESNSGNAMSKGTMNVCLRKVTNLGMTEFGSAPCFLLLRPKFLEESQRPRRFYYFLGRLEQ